MKLIKEANGIFKNRISLFVATFLIIGFFFLALPEKGYSGGFSPSLGCCRIQGERCLGCEPLDDCAIRGTECTAIDGNAFEVGFFCDSDFPDLCDVPRGVTGCCVISTGNCIEDQILTDPVDGGGCNEEGGIAWFFDTECSEVSQCPQFVTNVPTLSGWGLIAMAGILGIVGILGFMVMRRRKVTA